MGRLMAMRLMGWVGFAVDGKASVDMLDYERWRTDSMDA